MNNKINYALLRKDIAATSSSPKTIADACGLDQTLVAKLLHQGTAFRGLRLEAFVAIVDWLRQPADRYVERDSRLLGQDDNEDIYERFEGELRPKFGSSVEQLRAEISRLLRRAAANIGHIGYLENRLAWYEERERALVDWENEHPHPDTDSDDE